jgi:hypothetical protein
MKSLLVGLAMAVTLAGAVTIWAEVPPLQGHYVLYDSDAPPAMEILEMFYAQGFELATVVPLPDGRYLSYLRRVPAVTVPARRPKPAIDENGCAANAPNP